MSRRGKGERKRCVRKGKREEKMKCHWAGLSRRRLLRASRGRNL